MSPCTPDASLWPAARALTFAAELPDNVGKEVKRRRIAPQSQDKKEVAAHEPQPQWSMHDAHQLKAVEQLEKDWQEELKAVTAEEKECQEENARRNRLLVAREEGCQDQEGNARRNRLLVALEEGPTTDTVEFKPQEWV